MNENEEKEEKIMNNTHLGSTHRPTSIDDEDKLTVIFYLVEQK